jgi:hypothetical protein
MGLFTTPSTSNAQHPTSNGLHSGGLCLQHARWIFETPEWETINGVAAVQLFGTKADK